jgi:hypothetical protein
MGHFRLARLKEAALFAANAMGFQSTLVWSYSKQEFCGDRQIDVFVDPTMKPISRGALKVLLIARPGHRPETAR